MIVPRSIHQHDLAPGDRRAANFDWTGFGFNEVTTPDDADFATIYQILADVFEPLGEMETKPVLIERLGWQGKRRDDGRRFFYRMMALQKDGRIAAARDHGIIVCEEPSPSIYVHLSHIWVAPEWRRSGLAGWMRAFPVSDARACASVENMPITLIAEMEPLEDADQLPRLAAYARAGFRRVDPVRVRYSQPDFRPPNIIDATGGPRPLPFWLMLRQVGNEDQNSISGDELRRLVEALYALYGAGFRESDMAPLFRRLEEYPAAETRIRLEQYIPGPV